jgi:hypothetical protein
MPGWKRHRGAGKKEQHPYDETGKAAEPTPRFGKRAEGVGGRPVISKQHGPHGHRKS